MRFPVVPVAGVLVACILPAAAVPAAEAGILQPVAFDPADGPASPTVYLSATLDKPPGEGAGLGERAKVGTAGSTALKVAMAVDYRDRDAEADVIHLDFSGAGRFDAKKGILLAKLPGSRTDYYQATFGPAKVEATRGGKVFPLCVRGRYYRYKERRRAYVVFTAATAGTCGFGGKAVEVTALDCSGNFRFQDVPVIKPKTYGPPKGDLLIVGGVKVVYGQPVQVGGTWYSVTVSADGTKVSAEPANVSAGQITCPGTKWEIALATEDHKALLVPGGRDPVAVPAGTYGLVYYREFSVPDASGERATLLSGMIEHYRGKSPTVRVVEGQTAKLSFCSPLAAKITASARSDGTVRLGMGRPMLTGGISVQSLTRPGAWVFTKPVCPKIRITDEAGKLVDSVVLEYG